jgi:predicted nucleic acid-binding Zn ribbon protein
MNDDDWDDDDLGDESDEDTFPCPYCGNAIYDDSVQCPHCHMYIENERVAGPRAMWWIRVIQVTALILILVLSGLLYFVFL